jgi:TPR repeat protein
LSVALTTKVTCELLDDMTPDPAAAVDTLKPAAEKGNVEAQFMLAQAYAWNREKDGLLKAADWLQRAAQHGSAAAQSRLARELVRGAYWPIARDVPLKLDLKRDDEKALDYARLAAKQGDPSALVMLACYHESKREDEKARTYCDEAIAKNDPCGVVLKSMWYLNGTMYRQDTEESIRWAMRVASSKDPTALVWLGALYGDKVIPARMLKPKDFVASRPVHTHYALNYFTEAAARRSPAGLDFVKDYANDPKLRPSVAEWKLFERDYPEAAKAFCELTGFHPPQP